MASTYQYWRLYFNGPTNGGTGQNVFLTAWSFYDSNMNVISTSSVTATSSSGGSPWNAFNGTGFGWGSSTPPTTTPQWLQAQFTSAVTVSFIGITNDGGGSWIVDSPTAFLVQGSPDGITWTTIETYTGVVWYSARMLKYFDASTTVGNAKVTQIALEVFHANSSNALISQLALEALGGSLPDAKISQLALEALGGSLPNALISQIAIEIMYPYVPADQPIQQFLLP